MRSGKSADRRYVDGAREPIILLYHRVTQLDKDPWRLAVSPTYFASQMAALKRLAKPIPLETLADGLRAGDLPPRVVAVTFDDGYADNLHEAQPILEQYEVPATVFLTTGYLGAHREFWWDELEQLLLQRGELPSELQLNVSLQPLCWRLGNAAYWTQSDVNKWRAWCAWREAPTIRHKIYARLWELLVPLPEIEREQVLSDLRAWANLDRSVRPTHRALDCTDVAELARSPFVQIGSHAVSHTALAGLSDRAQKDEIEQSKSALERILSRAVSTFSYPFGQVSHYSQQTATYVAESGFSCACTNRNSRVGMDADPYQLPRLTAKNWSASQFSQLIEQWFDDQQQ